MKLKVVTVLLMLGIITKAEEIDLNCCPDKTFLETDGISPYCDDPENNTSLDIKPISCNKTVIEYLEHRVKNNGLQLKIKMGFWETFIHDPSKFCLGNSQATDNVTLVRAFVSCEEKMEAEMFDSKILSYCMIVSVVFLLITGLIYAGIPELRDLQGKSIVSFCASLGMALCFLIAMELAEFDHIHSCVARGFLTYYFIIAAFFWMNAISIQILKSLRNSSLNTYKWKDYIWYGVYGWGTPFVLTVILAILNFMPGDHPRPGIALNTCWFFNVKRQWIYMYSVMSILLLVNIAIFIYISLIMWRNTFSSTHVKSLKYKFSMTCKLSIVMGLPWIFEMINSLLPQLVFTIIFNIFNTLQGVFIFLVLVVLRVRVLKALHRHNLLCCLSDFVESKLATKDDHEEEVIHTIAVPLDDKINTQSYTT